MKLFSLQHFKKLNESVFDEMTDILKDDKPDKLCGIEVADVEDGRLYVLHRDVYQVLKKYAKSINFKFKREEQTVGGKFLFFKSSADKDSFLSGFKTYLSDNNINICS